MDTSTIWQIGTAAAGAVSDKRRHRNEVWLLMHKSNGPENETVAVRLYLDESGTDDPTTPQAVIGGILIKYSNFLHFEDCWDRMLDEFGIEPPLHMREFTPHGRFANIPVADRRRLFTEVAELIDSHKIASLAATLANREYEMVAQEIRDQFSVYAMCFNLIVVMNHKLAEDNRYSGRIPFILDSGNPYAEHVRQAHAAVMSFQREGHFLNAGGLLFDDDTNLGVLQAADLIAWGVRRSKSNKPFPIGFEPIPQLFDRGHNEASWTPELLKEVEGRLLRQLADKRANPEIKNSDEEPSQGNGSENFSQRF